MSSPQSGSGDTSQAGDAPKTAGVGDPRHLPGWLAQDDPGLPPCVRNGRRARASFLEKTLAAGAEMTHQSLLVQDVATREGLLQRLDPRAKLVSLLIALVAVGLVHDPLVLLLVQALVVLLVSVSRVPLGSFLVRIWVVVPAFTAVAVLPATLSVVTAGEVLVPLWSWHGTVHGPTAAGLVVAGRVLARATTSVALVLAVALTTPWHRLLAALRSVGLPAIFVLVVGMAHRYLLLLMGSVIDVYQARRARTVLLRHRRYRAHDGDSRRFVVAGAGALFSRSHRLAQEVHEAMTARGYRGEARVLTPWRTGGRDVVAVVVVLAVAVGILAVDRALAVDNLLAR